MRFIIDAQLPPMLANFLTEKGHSSIHTSWLKGKNDTSDSKINEISIEEARVVITKDTDFYHSFMIKKMPFKLLLIRVGNMGTRALKALFLNNLDEIIAALEKGDLVELTKTEISILY